MSINLSLKALEAFESAARNGSFVAAAQELSISPAAVSQLIRNLEKQVDRKLFHRVNRSIVLTEAGLEIQPHVSLAFEEINLVSSKLKANQPQRKLVISMPVSIAVDWLSLKSQNLPQYTGKSISPCAVRRTLCHSIKSRLISA